jgi:hypothetical protein
MPEGQLFRHGSGIAFQFLIDERRRARQAFADENSAVRSAKILFIP